MLHVTCGSHSVVQSKDKAWNDVFFLVNKSHKKTKTVITKGLSEGFSYISLKQSHPFHVYAVFSLKHTTVCDINAKNKSQI